MFLIELAGVSYRVGWCFLLSRLVFLIESAGVSY